MKHVERATNAGAVLVVLFALYTAWAAWSTRSADASDRRLLDSVKCIPVAQDPDGLAAQVQAGVGPVAFDTRFIGALPDDCEAKVQFWWRGNGIQHYFRQGTIRSTNVEHGDVFETWFFSPEGGYDPATLYIGVDVYLVLHRSLTRPMEYLLYQPGGSDAD